ncbi:MAG: hypothetical protein WD751_11810 [Anaerolineales bacterium]
MAKDTITFILHGDIPLELFSEAIERWSKLVDILSKEVGERTDIEWEIAKLKSSDPTVIVRGRSPDMPAVEKVVAAQGIVWRALEKKEPIPYSDAVSSRARAITGILNGKISHIEIKTDESSAIVEESFFDEGGTEEREYSFGTVTGYVETITKHNKLRFTIYDLIFNRAVFCQFNDEQKKMVVSVWEKRVRIAGKIYRDTQTGRPIEIRDVTEIELLDDSPPGSFEAASGIIPWRKGDELPEEVIRRIRNDE